MPETGQSFSHYTIVEKLGAEGMGEVFKARDTRLDRTVALKVLKSPAAPSAEMRLRFEREAKAIAALNHPHICTLHDIGRKATRISSSWNTAKAKRWLSASPKARWHLVAGLAPR